MPGKDPLSQIGDLAQLQANADKIIEIVQTISTSIKSVPDISLAYKNSSGGAELKKNTDDLVKANKDLLTAQQQLDAERAKSLTLEGDIAKQLAVQRELNRQKTTDMKAEAREAAGLNDAYKKLELQYRAAQREAKNLAATPGTPQGAVDAANKNAKGLSDQLKAIDAAVGQHQRNVGNYSEALKTLEVALEEAKGRMDQFTQSGQQNSAEAQKVASEVNLLGQLVSQQSAGFTSLSREIMATGKALETMAAQGLSGTQYFKELQAQMAESRRELKDFREDQRLLANDTPKLAALTLVAKGLAGAYAVGVGAIGLFSDGNEKLEKELNKLVAVMTVLQGLHELNEFLERKGAIATIASGVAQGFKNFVMTGSVKPMQASTAAQAENTIVQDENILATEADIVAKEAQAAATEEVAVATESASGAMVGFRIAFLATGIGLLLILLPAIANAMDLFKKSTKEQEKETEELNGYLQRMNDILTEQIKLADQAGEHMKKNLENALALAQKNNQSFYDQYAIRKQIADLAAKTAEDDLKQAGSTNDIGKAYKSVQGEVDKLTKDLQPLIDKQKELNTWLKVDIDAGPEAEATAKKVKESLDGVEKEIAANKKLTEDKKKFLDDYDKTNIDKTALEIERARFTADEERELAKAIAVTRAQAVIDSNALVLSNDKSTQQQRITAESSNLVQQLKIIEAEKTAKLGDNSLTPAKRAQIEVESSAAVAKARTDGLEKIRLINEDYRKREQAAEYDIFKSAIETQSKAAEESSNNVKFPLQSRLAAFQEYEARQRQLINADADFQRQKAGQTADELLAIEVARQAKLQELFTAGQVKQSQILLSSLDQQQKSLEGSAKIDGIKGQIKALEDLNAAYKSGAISADAFAKKKDQISNSASQSALEMQLTTLKFIEGEYKRYGQDVTAIDLQIAETEKQLADKKIQRDEQDAARKKELRQKELELAQQFEQTVFSFIQGRYEKEANEIQKQIDHNNQLKEAEVSRISGSTLSEQDKAATLLEINERNQAQNEALARRQRDLKVKEANWAKAESAAETFQQGTIAAIAALKIPIYGEAEAIVIEALTLARVAQILSKPVPTYAAGTASSKGGWALTDELGPELYRTPSGKTFLGNDQPTFRYLEAGTEITPYHKLQQYRTLDPTVNTTKPNNQLEKKIDRLNNTIERMGQAQINATKKQKAPIINVHNDATFWAHVKNSTQ